MVSVRGSTQALLGRRLFARYVQQYKHEAQARGSECKPLVHQNFAGNLA